MRRAPKVCDENRPTAAFDRFELRSGQLIVGCKCVRNDGMQHECKRSKCRGRPECMDYPEPTCAPSRPCPRPKPTDRNPATGPAAPDPEPEAVAKRRAQSRRLRQMARAQYDDSPRPLKLFQLCRHHAVQLPLIKRVKTPPPTPPPPPGRKRCLLKYGYEVAAGVPPPAPHHHEQH